MRMGSLDMSKVEQTVWKRCNVFIAAVLCTVYQNMESGIVLYTLETIASIRSLCIPPHYVLLFHLKFEITDVNGLFTPTTFHTSLMFKRDSKMIFLNKSCSLSSSSTTEPSSLCKAPQESLESPPTMQMPQPPRSIYIVYISDRGGWGRVSSIRFGRLIGTSRWWCVHLWGVQRTQQSEVLGLSTTNCIHQLPRFIHIHIGLYLCSCCQGLEFFNLKNNQLILKQKERNRKGIGSPI